MFYLLFNKKKNKNQTKTDIKNCFELVHKDVRYTLSCTQPVQRDLWFMELKNQMKHFFMQTMMREDRKEQRSQHGFKPKLREILADHELALFFRAFLHTIYNYEVKKKKNNQN